FFPQMRPEKSQLRDGVSKYTALNIPEEWVPVLQKAGIITVDMLKEANPGKLHQELCGLNKKYKLEFTNPTLDVVKAWVESAK
ncbi:MAG: DUF4332 domain-containing protein, partial [Bacteroidales bacterium]